MIEKLKGIECLVEATSAEQQWIWEDYSSESDSNRFDKIDWKHEPRGLFIQVTELDNRPVMVCLNFATIEGRKYIFYYSPSQVCDWKAIEDWIAERCPNVIEKSDAMNFGNTLKR